MFKLFEHGNTTTQIDVLDALLSSSECSPTKLKSPLTHFLVSAHLGRVSLLCDESVIIGGHLQSLPQRRGLARPRSVGGGLDPGTRRAWCPDCGILK